MMMNKTLSLVDLAAMTGATIIGNQQKTVTGLAPLETAGPDDVSFLVKKNKKLPPTCGAGAIFVPKDMEALTGYCGILLQVANPYLASAIAHNYFLQKPFVAKGIHPRAWIGEESTLGEAVSIGPGVVIGERVKIGERVTIEPGTVVGDDVTIGNDCTIRANVTIYQQCILGNGIVIHSGTVIGSDGYGYATDENGRHVKRPQVGIVRIEDDVEIGANCCVDRAAYGETVIKSGAKIDNLVQIGHNVVVGENSLLVSQVGIAGSTILGRNVVMGGQSAASGHISLGDQVMIAARGGVHTNLSAKSKVAGVPAIDVKQWAKCCAVYNRLPDLQSRVRQNSKALQKLLANGEKEAKNE